MALSLARFSREASLICAVERACAAIASLHVLACAGASATMLRMTQTKPSVDAGRTTFTSLDLRHVQPIEPPAAQRNGARCHASGWQRSRRRERVARSRVRLKPHARAPLHDGEPEPLGSHHANTCRRY